jgi:hypothetical protein
MKTKNIKTNSPDYKRIFTDIILIKYPDKHDDCKDLLNKNELLALDIINLNQKIFGVSTDKESYYFNQSHRSYNKQAILNILDYQKKNKLNNTQVAMHFSMSRNTISKWKRLLETNLLDN